MQKILCYQSIPKYYFSAHNKKRRKQIMNLCKKYYNKFQTQKILNIQKSD